MIDPFHWEGPDEEEPVLLDDEVPTGPARTWEDMLAIADIPYPDELRERRYFRPELLEHYGPGNHKSGSPQSSHSKGGVERATAGIEAGLEQGGASIRTSGVTPSTGYMVSYPPSSGHGKIIDASAPREVIRAEVESFVQRERDFVTSHADRYIGAWSDSGKIYLDVSQNFPPERRAQAIEAGRERNQLAIFDLQTFDEIPTGGTGL